MARRVVFGRYGVGNGVVWDMAKYIITRASMINACNSDGKLHLMFTDTERPCKEAFLEEIVDTEGVLCSRFFIEAASIEELYEIGERYDVDVLITKNSDFPEYISVVLYDEEIDRSLFEPA